MEWRLKLRRRVLVCRRTHSSDGPFRPGSTSMRADCATLPLKRVRWTREMPGRGLNGSRDAKDQGCYRASVRLRSGRPGPVQPVGPESRPHHARPLDQTLAPASSLSPRPAGDSSREACAAPSRARYQSGQLASLRAVQPGRAHGIALPQSCQGLR